MELDDAVLAHACGELGDSAACALWEGFLWCVRVLSCEHESRSNVCSDMSQAIPYPSKPPPTLEERGGRMQVWPDQGHSSTNQPRTACAIDPWRYKAYTVPR